MRSSQDEQQERRLLSEQIIDFKLRQAELQAKVNDYIESIKKGHQDFKQLSDLLTYDLKPYIDALEKLKNQFILEKDNKSIAQSFIDQIQFFKNQITFNEKILKACAVFIMNSLISSNDPPLKLLISLLAKDKDSPTIKIVDDETLKKIAMILPEKALIEFVNDFLATCKDDQYSALIKEIYSAGIYLTEKRGSKRSEIDPQKQDNRENILNFNFNESFAKYLTGGKVGENIEIETDKKNIKKKLLLLVYEIIGDTEWWKNEGKSFMPGKTKIPHNIKTLMKDCEAQQASSKNDDEKLLDLCLKIHNAVNSDRKKISEIFGNPSSPNTTKFYSLLQSLLDPTKQDRLAGDKQLLDFYKQLSHFRDNMQATSPAPKKD